MENLLFGDALELIKKIPSNSIDAIITDPPYGMDYQSAWRIDPEKRFKKIANDKKPFIWFLYDAFRVIKDGGSIICFSDWKNQKTWEDAMIIAGFEVKSQVIWDREVHGMGDLKASFGPQHDVIWFGIKGKFNFPNKRPKSVIRAQRISGDNLVHPNEKPVSLMEKLIEAVVPISGHILDPFMGSGSTGQAAKNMRIDFTGIEMNKDYFEIAQKRLGSSK